MNKISDNNMMNFFYNAIPAISVIFDDNISIALTDTQKYLYTKYSNKLQLGAREGDRIPEGGAISDAIRSRRNVIKVVPENVYGTAFKSFAIPIEEGDEVVGVFVVGKSLESKTTVMKITKDLIESLSQISLSINQVANGVQELATMNEQLLMETKEANERTADTDEILTFIQGVSSQTNLLGLNASIEAARAGEAGRGFDVVAQEIRMLSNSSNESIQKIDTVIKHIQANCH